MTNQVTYSGVPEFTWVWGFPHIKNRSNDLFRVTMVSQQLTPCSHRPSCRDPRNKAPDCLVHLSCWEPTVYEAPCVRRCEALSRTDMPSKLRTKRCTTAPKERDCPSALAIKERETSTGARPGGFTEERACRLALWNSRI